MCAMGIVRGRIVCYNRDNTLYVKFTVLEMIYITPLLIRKQNFKRYFFVCLGDKIDI